MKTGSIEILVNGKQMRGDSLPDIYRLVLEYLVDTKRIERLSLPIATSGVRYILANEPVHQRGNGFVVQISYKGFHMEAHKERDNGLKQLNEYVLEPIGLKMQITEV